MHAWACCILQPSMLSLQAGHPCRHSEYTCSTLGSGQGSHPILQAQRSCAAHHCCAAWLPGF